MKLEKQYIRKNIAAAIPPAADCIPPKKAPINPESFASEIAPLLRRFPKPVSGTVAPHPAKSIKYL